VCVIERERERPCTVCVCERERPYTVCVCEREREAMYAYLTIICMCAFVHNTVVGFKKSLIL
jgi:hypothetical protein